MTRTQRVLEDPDPLDIDQLLLPFGSWLLEIIYCKERTLSVVWIAPSGACLDVRVGKA
jgi:hypothetical protein